MKLINFELLSAVLAVTAAFLDTREQVVARPLSILSTLAGLLVYLKVGLYASFLLDIIYIFLDLYGWHHWLYGNKDKTPLSLSKIGTKLLVTLLLIGSAGALSLGCLLDQFSDADLVYLDSTNATFYLIAYWMLMKKKLEGWILIFFLDAYYAAICYYKALYIFSIQHLIFVFLAVYGYNAWRKSYLRKKAL